MPAAALALLAAGCGGSGGKAAAAAGTTTAPATTATGRRARADAAAFKTFQACLKAHGLTISFPRRTRATRAARAGTPRRAPTANQRQALTACRSDLPQGARRFGFGGRRPGSGGPASPAFRRYTVCLRSHGVAFGSSSPASRRAFAKAAAACTSLQPNASAGTGSP